MRPILLLLLIHLVPVVLSAQSVVSKPALPPDTTARPILLVFSGSDWCQPCIRFEKQVLKDSVFQHFAAANLELIKADFPQRKKLTPAQRQQNEQLAGQYNPEGEFPHIVLLRPDRTMLAALPADAGSGMAFIALLKAHLSKINGP